MTNFTAFWVGGVIAIAILTFNWSRVFHFIGQFGIGPHKHCRRRREVRALNTGLTGRAFAFMLNMEQKYGFQIAEEWTGAGGPTNIWGLKKALVTADHQHYEVGLVIEGLNASGEFMSMSVYNAQSKQIVEFITLETAGNPLAFDLVEPAMIGVLQTLEQHSGEYIRQYTPERMNPLIENINKSAEVTA